jgi:hypothetical protein
MPGDAGKTADPLSTSTVKKLTIQPADAQLMPGDTQAFEALDENNAPVANVQWSVFSDDKLGWFPSKNVGVLRVKDRFYRSHRIAIAAEVVADNPAKNEEDRKPKDALSDPAGRQLARGSAMIELDPVPSWVPFLGGGWVVLFFALLALLVFNWSRLCPQCTPPGISVSPPVVTLGAGQAQQFVASATATWTNTVNAAGLYVAPSKIDAEQLVTITATSVSDPKQSAMAVVRLSPAGSLSVVPSKVTVKQRQSVDLTTAATGLGTVAPVWLRPAAGDITTSGRYTAPDDPTPQSIIVLAQAQTPATPAAAVSTLIAGALVSVVPEKPANCPSPPESGLWGVVLLVGLVGALGGLIHAIGSFGTYVGNRELKASWLCWYSLKPVLSAAVAVLVYFVFRAGLGAPDLGLAAGDCLKIAGFAGLVGLFAEQATVKLKDIFEAIFTPRRDPREDKAGKEKKEPKKSNDQTSGSVKANEEQTEEKASDGKNVDG